MTAFFDRHADPRAEDQPLASTTVAGTWVLTLLDSWYTRPSPVPETLPDLEELRAKLVFGYAAHTHGLARLAMQALDSGFTIEAAPTVRTAFECAITAQWLVHVPSAVEGLYREEGRQLQTIVRRMRQHLTPEAFDELLSKLGEPQDLSDLTTAADGEARQIRRRFEALQGAGLSAYINYGEMSTYSHASPRAAWAYADVDFDTTPAVYRYSMVKWPSAVDVLAQSVVWAGLAVDRFDAKHHARSQLQQARRELGVPELKQSPENWLAEQKAAGVERRARQAAAAAERRGRRGKPAPQPPQPLQPPQQESTPGQPAVPAAFVKAERPATKTGRLT